LRVVPHDLAWKDDFAAEKARIQRALANPGVRIEHVGSTAIPTVHAKPILDIAILCDEKGLDPVVRALTEVGYEFRGQFEDEAGHYYARLDRADVRLCQAHIFTEATSDWHAKLMFRDVLGRNLTLAREYDDYKRALAASRATRAEYAEEKSRWVDTFIEKVRKAASEG
jgi:GrpB-like predicted nucleotidyltransferase (UPF0157 family)